MKHTKGPWVAAIDPGITTVDNNKCKVFSANSSFFAIIDGCEYSEGVANARLIAAAPEMLEALERVAIYLSKLPEQSWAQQELLRSVNAAIAKARGEG